MSNLSAAILRFQRNINWIEEKNITKGEQVFSNFISFKDAQLIQNTHWHPYFSEVFRLNSAATNIRINIQKVISSNLNNKYQIQNQDFLKNIKDYDKAAQLFNFIPALNNVKDKNGDRVIEHLGKTGRNDAIGVYQNSYHCQIQVALQYTEGGTNYWKDEALDREFAKTISNNFESLMNTFDQQPG